MSELRHEMPLLRRRELAADPIEQFGAWFELALERVPMPEAMTLATVDGEGRPDARLALLRGHDDAGFRFHSNYESAKSAQLSASPSAALVFHWRELDRQVRVRGPASKLPEAESDAYFASRPRDSQLGAWASPQSAEIADRAELDRRLAGVTARFAGVEVPRPSHWGGWIVRHEVVEFWQGQSGRLHDRFRYRRAESGWEISRLAP